MHSIWHVKFLLLLPAIHESKCCLYFLNICNKFQPRSQLTGICFSVFLSSLSVFSFCLFFCLSLHLSLRLSVFLSVFSVFPFLLSWLPSFLVMPKDLTANLNLADISSVISYTKYCKEISVKLRIFPSGMILSAYAAQESSKAGSTLCLFEADRQKLKILPFIPKTPIRSQLCKSGKLAKSSKAGGRSRPAFPPIHEPHWRCLPLCPLTGRAMQWEVGLRGINPNWLSAWGMCQAKAVPRVSGTRRRGGHVLQECWLEVFTNPFLIDNDGWPLRKYMP